MQTQMYTHAETAAQKPNFLRKMLITHTLKKTLKGQVLSQSTLFFNKEEP